MKDDFLLQVFDLWFRYSNEDGYILRGVNFTLNFGEIALITGTNGSGKTTFLKLVSGLIKPDKGLILFNGKNIHSDTSYLKKIGFVPQNSEDLFLRKTVKDEILYSCENFEIANPEERLEEACKLLDIDKELLPRNPFSLSHGEAKRVALAAAVAHDPDLLILDEPFVGLDKPGKRILENLLKIWKEKGKSVLLTSQRLNVLANVKVENYVLKEGTLIKIDSHNLS
ncbi:ABC transporter ATP-binding protein [Pseudothermotoga thermarum]|uniref:ABC transporter related protein n=1 Tax=Pseudothermotoga thermarum DSM 5069 TaxID=688269 RepID=F7YWJ3_9THEM|nr:ABC transporter ATP-binding protein [Pseudothermotoga thermarum]AEH51974.1 ABC transporter related protein [Pseudothermotoga thermarum DSM 5069]